MRPQGSLAGTLLLWSGSSSSSRRRGARRGTQRECSAACRQNDHVRSTAAGSYLHSVSCHAPVGASPCQRHWPHARRTNTLSPETDERWGFPLIGTDGGVADGREPPWWEVYE